MTTGVTFPPTISALNPWWRADFSLHDHPDYKTRPRYAFPKLLQTFNETNLMVFIKGLRRLGKSTLLRQLALNLIESHRYKGSDIFLIEFSETFNDLETTLLNIPLAVSVVLLDEIQYCDRWRDTLKSFYDAFPQTKIIFTGSAAISFTQEKESLMGRFLPINLPPLSFHEYLYLKHGWAGEKNKNPFVNLEEWYEFVQFGEFPETLKINSPDLRYSYLRESIINPLITQDASLYKVEKKQEFLMILKALASNIGQVINKSNLSAEIGISWPLTDKYLSILEDIGIIKFVSNYHKSVRKQILSDKKIYFSSINLCLSLLDIPSYKNLAIKEFKGHIFENAVFNELILKHPNLFYWRRNGNEIDFLTFESGKLSAYEVKSSSAMKKPEAGRYFRLAEKAGADEVSIIYGSPTEDNNPRSKNRICSFLWV